jgi:hypothetical protein
VLYKAQFWARFCFCCSSMTFPHQLLHKVIICMQRMCSYIPAVIPTRLICAVCINADLCRLYQWSRANGISINSSKSQAMIINPSQLTRVVPRIHLGDAQWSKIAFLTSKFYNTKSWRATMFIFWPTLVYSLKIFLITVSGCKYFLL